MVNKWSLIIVLALALFLRTYRLGDLLGFYYDQGRDASAIWNLWHKGDFFLIGPTTGIEGIFLGPFYYYLIAPAYLVTGGNPVGPAIFLALINVAGIYVIYKIGERYYGRTTGLLAAVLITLSANLVQAHRWLSNPTPLPLSAALAMWSLLAIIHGAKNKWWWVLLGLMLGLSLHFEAASAIFFLPAVALVLLWRRLWPHWLSLVAFGVTLIPQLVFDLRNNHLLLKAFEKFLFAEKSFQPVLTNLLQTRLNFYFETFTSQFVLDRKLAGLFSVLIVVLAIAVWRRINNLTTKVLLIWCLVPVMALLFYHGNNGYVWGYYFTGVYPFVALLVGIILASAWRINWGRWIVGLVLLMFILQNLPVLRSYLVAGTDGPIHVTLGPSVAAVDWVYRDAGSRSFNVDVYVPPVIPHAYDYLVLWRGVRVFGRQPTAGLVPLLYTIYEVDPPHPERLEAWQKRQAGIGVVEEETRFGGVWAQRRHRL